MRREIHPNWTALAANLLPAQSRQVIRASWCRETAFDPSWWTEENPARGQCGVTAALIHEITGLPVIRGRATLPDGTVESFYWNAGVDLAGRQYPQDTVIRVFGDIQGRAAYLYQLTNPDLVRRLEILRDAFHAKNRARERARGAG